LSLGEGVMKKFVVVGLFALFGGATGGACDEGEFGRGVKISAEEYQALYDRMYPILEELVEIYETGNVKVGNSDIMNKVDGMIRDLDGFITPQEICKGLDFPLAVTLNFCSDLNEGFDMEDEQKIGEEIIQRWKDLGFSRKTERQ
jgi:hypothetical protein